MKQERLNQLRRSLETAFINKNLSSNLEFKPQFISNNYKEGHKIISFIEKELLSCDEFFISVAFITVGGITPILQTLRELERRNIKGKIITTDYLKFSEPKALCMLKNFSNIQLKMFITENEREGFHTKGYIFKKGDIYTSIIGSSNMTLSAFTVNKEWNTKIISTENGEYTVALLCEFENLWNSRRSLYIDDFIDTYTNIYNKNLIIKNKVIDSEEIDNSFIKSHILKPNSMQKGFIDNLSNIYEFRNS